jgi:hypothetical protein
MHGDPQSLSLSLEVLGMSLSGTVKSVTVTVRGAGDERIENIALSYDTDEDDYRRTYALPTYPAEGLWFVAEAKVTTDKGSYAVLSRNSAHDAFTQSIHTSNGNEVSGVLDDGFYPLLAQDYAPPSTSAKWLYVGAYSNGSTPTGTDPALYAYRQGQTTKWFASNDDGGGLLMPALKLPVANGERVYIQVKDIYRNGGAYSVLASLSLGLNATNVKVTQDLFEPDDDVTNAKALPLDAFHHHLFDVKGESDWLVIDVP